jgi:hypothetical protein
MTQWMRLTWDSPAFTGMSMLVREEDVMKFLCSLATLGVTPEVSIEDNPVGKMSVYGDKVKP